MNKYSENSYIFLEHAFHYKKSLTATHPFLEPRTPTPLYTMINNSNITGLIKVV